MLMLDAYRDFVSGDAVVCVDDQVLSRQRRGLLELGCQEHADTAEQLELSLLDVDAGQEAVEVVDSQREDLRVALLLLAHLQHPVGDDLAHVRLHLRLQRGEVVKLGLLLRLVFLSGEDVGQDSGVLEEDGVLVAAAVCQHHVVLLLLLLLVVVVVDLLGEALLVGKEIVHLDWMY